MDSISHPHHLGVLNPNAPEFRPSTTLPPPPHHHFILPSQPSLLFFHHSLYLSQPTLTLPYNDFTGSHHHPFFFSSQNSFHYLTSPPPPISAFTPLPPTPAPTSTGGATSSRHNSISHIREREIRNTRKTSTLKFSQLTATTSRTHTDAPNYKYIHKGSRSSNFPSSSNKANQLNHYQHHPVKPGGRETTVMIRNIPNELTRRMLIKFLDDFCYKENNKAEEDNVGGGDQESQEAVEYDFVYLPIDFCSKLNKGYAFVNFTTPRGVWRLQEANMENQTWGFCDTPRKRREIAVAMIQGKSALMKRFENSRFGCESDEYLPVCFSPPRNGAVWSKKNEASEKIIGERYQQIKSWRKSPFHYA